MVWWLFKRKKEGDDPSLHSNLRVSFSNIKKDMDSLGSWVKVLDNQDQKLVEEIKIIKQELIILNKNIHQINEVLEKNDLEEEEYEEDVEEDYEVETDFDEELLTETQEIILVKLYKLQKEGGTDQVPLKALAKECYDRDYSQVRSTLSEYTGYLEELNALKRKKKGKQVFVALTNKGEELAKKLGREKGFLFVKKQQIQRKKRRK